jgi:predicted esterase
MRWIVTTTFLVSMVFALAWSSSTTPDAHATVARTGMQVQLPAIHVPRSTPLPDGRVTLDSEIPVHAFAPLSSVAAMAAAAAGAPSPAPIVFMLHGMCGEPLSQCEYWSDAGRVGSWLMCPAGNVRCGANWDWQGSGEVKARHLDAAVAALRVSYAEHVSVGNDILIGFSRGAFVARDVAYARPGRYRGLVLIGAAMKPDPARLKRAGIRRVVLASGDRDGARSTMQLATEKLRRGGLEARFVSLGPIWHQLPADLEPFVRDAVQWIRQSEGKRIVM